MAISLTSGGVDGLTYTYNSSSSGGISQPGTPSVGSVALAKASSSLKTPSSGSYMYVTISGQSGTVGEASGGTSLSNGVGIFWRKS